MQILLQLKPPFEDTDSAFLNLFRPSLQFCLTSIVMVSLTSSSPWTSSLAATQSSRNHNSWHPIPFSLFGHCYNLLPSPIKPRNHQKVPKSHRRSRMTVLAVTEGSAKKSSEKEDPSIPSWARPDSEEPPPWARNETQTSSSSFEFPSYFYLLASTITAIAAVGSVFEYVNQRPVFGVLNSDSVFYVPLLGFFAFTGVPASAFLWYKSVQLANKEADEQDRRDGYL